MTEWFVSIITRVAIKMIVDFTGCIHFRHPMELGGLYYSLTLLQAQVGSAVFAKLYVDASDGDAEALAVEMVYAVVATASITWACSYALFLAHIKKVFRARSSIHEGPSSTRWTTSTIPRPAIIRKQR